jgi:hypothetical protein
MACSVSDINDISRIGRILPICTAVVAAVGTEPWTF